MSLGLLFPGQGSQHVGMGANLFDSRNDLLGSSADDVLGWSLRDLCLHGPEDRLTRTEYAQPALFAIGYALWQTLQPEMSGPVAAAAGHSLGEYTALAAAGAVGYPAALELVARRGRAMAAAADLEPSGMAALIGADLDLAMACVAASREDGGRLQVANINSPGQVVVAGAAADLEWLAGNADALGVRRVIPLKVAGAFHSSFMEQAAEEMGPALAGVAFAEPEFPVWSNTTARPHHVEDLASNLVAQVTSPVRFSDSLEDMWSHGVRTFLHCGPGDVTAGMVRKTLPEADVVVVASVADIGAAAEALVSVE